MVEQGSIEWHQQRLGCVTASKLSDLMAKTKSGPSASRKNYMMQLLCERLTGKREESYTNAAMQRGTELEPIARGHYEGIYGVEVEQTGFVLHPTIAKVGASPDGLVGNDGLIEIKCPNTAQHVEFLRTEKIDSGYQLQMMLQMMCTGRKWCDFISYDDRMPESLQFACVRFNFSQAVCDEITAEITAFLSELDTLESELKARMIAEQQ